MAGGADIILTHPAIESRELGSELIAAPVAQYLVRRRPKRRSAMLKVGVSES